MAFEGFLGKAGLQRLIDIIKPKLITAENNITDLQNRTTNLETTVNGASGQPSLENRLTSYVDSQDFLNLAPKIGYYQEDIVQVQGTYAISHVDLQMRSAPVITTDNIGREVMYFLGSGGGPNYNKLKFHKAYRDGSSDWIWYNSDIKINGIHKDAIFKGIYGCDNTYVIVKVNYNGDKFYKINTNYSFDEENWSAEQLDFITSDNQILVNKGENTYLTDGDQVVTHEGIIHIRYFIKSNTTAVVYQVSHDMAEEYWYYVVVYGNKKVNNVYKYGILRWTKCKGLKEIPLADEYDYIRDADNKIVETKTENPGSERVSGVCNVLLFENGLISIVIHSGTRFYVKQGDSPKVLKGIGHPQPLIYKVNDSFFKGAGGGSATVAATSTMYKDTKNYLIKDKANSSKTYDDTPDNPFPSGSDKYIYELERSLNINISNCVGYGNNSSYDTEKNTFYRTTLSQNKYIGINTMTNSSNEILDVANAYKGLKYKYCETELHTPDASFWGKRFGLGTMMWDKIFISCLNSKGSHLLYCDVDNWQFLSDIDHNKMYIEPGVGLTETVNNVEVPKQVLFEISDNDFTSVLQKNPVSNITNLYAFPFENFEYKDTVTETTLTVPKTNNPKCFKASKTVYGDINGFISVKLSNGDPAYYKAQYNPIDKKIAYWKFSNTGEGSDFKVTVPNNPTIVSVPDLVKSDFKTGDANNTFIYPGFVAYNPLANKFFIWSTLDYTTIASAKDHEKIPHMVGIRQNGTVVHYENQHQYKWNYNNTIGNYPDSIKLKSTEYRMPYIPFGCTVIDKNNMLVWFISYNSNYNNYIYVLYSSEDEFETLTNDSDKCRSRGTPSGTNYLAELKTGRFAIPVIYGGKKLGFCGQGETDEHSNYGTDTYKINFRIQNRQKFLTIDENGNHVIANDYNTIGKSSEETSIDKIKEDANDSFNTYTMFNQSAAGLTAYLPKIPIFLGGYFSWIPDDKLQVNNLIDNLYEGKSGAVTNLSGDGNYIYISRGKTENPENGNSAEYDRNSILVEVDQKRTIPEGAPSFNKICIAKIQTRNGQIIEGGQTNFRINTGYNSWKFDPDFQAFLTNQNNG